MCGLTWVWWVVTFSNFCLVKHWRIAQPFYHVNHFYFSDKEHSANHSHMSSTIYTPGQSSFVRTGKKGVKYTKKTAQLYWYYPRVRVRQTGKGDDCNRIMGNGPGSVDLDPSTRPQLFFWSLCPRSFSRCVWATDSQNLAHFCCYSPRLEEKAQNQAFCFHE